MGARDFFASVREAALEIRRIEARIERMRSAPGWSGAVAVAGGPAPSNGTAGIDRALDYEEAVRPVLAQDRDRVAAARRILYGGGAGGVALGIGASYADAVWWRACAGGTWDEVAERCMTSRATAIRWYGVAMDYVDAVGPEGAAEGVEA